MSGAGGSVCEPKPRHSPRSVHVAASCIMNSNTTDDGYHQTDDHVPQPDKSNTFDHTSFSPLLAILIIVGVCCALLSPLAYYAYYLFVKFQTTYEAEAAENVEIADDALVVAEMIPEIQTDDESVSDSTASEHTEKNTDYETCL